MIDLTCPPCRVYPPKHSLAWDPADARASWGSGKRERG